MHTRAGKKIQLLKPTEAVHQQCKWVQYQTIFVTRKCCTLLVTEFRILGWHLEFGFFIRLLHTGIYYVTCFNDRKGSLIGTVILKSLISAHNIQVTILLHYEFWVLDSQMLKLSAVGPLLQHYKIHYKILKIPGLWKWRNACVPSTYHRRTLSVSSLHLRRTCLCRWSSYHRDPHRSILRSRNCTTKNV